MTENESRFARLLAQFDHFDPEFEANFFEVSKELRERCPVVHSEAHGGYWTYSRYADVQEGFGNDKRYSAEPTATIPVNPAAVPIIPLQAPAEVHRDFRKILDPYFRLGAVNRYEEGIRQITTELIDAFIEDGRCEFIADFAHRLPGALIFRLFLGLPESEVGEAFRLTMLIMHGIGTDEGATVHEDFMRLIAKMLERRRQEPPRDDIIEALFNGEVAGRPLSEDEVLRCILMLIAAGLDTTAHSLGTMMISLIRRPELRRRLLDEPDALPRAIEEMMRWEPPAGALVRTATEDVEIDGKKVRAGDRVLLLVAGANRDESVFANAEELDIDRPQVRNFAFGYGAHYCLGVHLARLEMRVALEELLGRLHDVRIVDPDIAYDSGTSRGPIRLQLAFAPGKRSTAQPVAGTAS